MEEEIKNIIDNIDAMDILIYYINLALEPVIPQYHNVNSFFLTGRCNIYAQILADIFGKYATVYDNHDHVITKIGNHYYDVRGLIDQYENLNEYKETPLEYLKEPLIFGIGNYKEDFDEEIIKIGVNAGNKYIKSRTINKTSKTF